MSVLKVNSIVQMLDKVAPKKLAENWDNVGLIVGDGSQKVESVLISLDAPEWVVDEAVEKKVDMIICHHPLIFKPIKRVTKDDSTGRKLIKLITHNIALYAMHTNYDSAQGGMNDLLIERLGFEKSELIDPKELDRIFKLVVYIPLGYEEKVKEALFKAGAGNIGNYGECGFQISGMGQYKPGEKTTPFIGTVGKLETTPEIRFETVVRSSDLGKVMKALIKNHPYEEVAYDLIPTENTLDEYGLGKIGELQEPEALSEFAQRVKAALRVDSLKIIGASDKMIKKVAVIGGSGSDYWQKAKIKGADVLITGDVDYHTMIDALEGGMTLIDAGHFGTEKIMMEAMTERLRNLLDQAGYSNVAVEVSTTNHEVGISI